MENYNQNMPRSGMKLSDLNIPPDPNRKFFNCRRTNQNALIGESFWIVDFHEKTVETEEGKTAEKYVLKCKRDLNEPDEKAFKFFTGSIDIKYKLDYAREANALPIQVTLNGDGRNFDIV